MEQWHAVLRAPSAASFSFMAHMESSADFSAHPRTEIPKKWPVVHITPGSMQFGEADPSPKEAAVPVLVSSKKEQQQWKK